MDPENDTSRCSNHPYHPRLRTPRLAANRCVCVIVPIVPRQGAVTTVFGHTFGVTVRVRPSRRVGSSVNECNKAVITHVVRFHTYPVVPIRLLPPDDIEKNPIGLWSRISRIPIIVVAGGRAAGRRGNSYLVNTNTEIPLPKSTCLCNRTNSPTAGGPSLPCSATPAA